MELTIVIPIRNEAIIVGSALRSLTKCIAAAGRSGDVEIIIVDGGSTDASVCIAENYADCVLISEPGRAYQMNAGAAVANGNYLLFLHIDTLLPQAFFQAMPLVDETAVWGFFTVQLSGDDWRYRMIENGIRLRSQLTHIATGDQCIFIKRSLFDQLGGFATIPLMEDVEISKRLRRLAAPIIIKKNVITSSRRWRIHGVLRTVLFMWWLRWCYFMGVSPSKLARKYYGAVN